MPKDTFFNLSEDKKNRIMEIVIDEFANNDYQNVSISRIVKNASIAKGSFYQYFIDKKDLYGYLIHKISEKKVEYLRHHLQEQQEIDFFEFLKSVCVAGIIFSKENPKFSKIAERLVKGEDDMRIQILGHVEADGVKLYESLLTQGIEAGQLRGNIDIQMTAIMISSLTTSVSEHFIRHSGEEDYTNCVPYIDKVIDILKSGIQA